MRDFDDLRSDQQLCIDELYGSDRSYVVMRMGGGKTATCLTTMHELIEDGVRRRGIVLAPPLVAATVWPMEPAKWAHLTGLTVEPLLGGPAKRIETLKESTADILSVSDGITRWLVDYLLALPDDDPLLDMFAYDEPKLKNPRGGTIGKALEELAPRVKTMWKFSGTPRPNGFEDLYMPAKILKPGLWNPKFDEWRRRNFMPLDFHGYSWEVHDFRARQLVKDVNTFMVRAAEPKGARKGTLSSGPEYDIEVDLPAAARKKYKEMERDLIIEVMRSTGIEDMDDPALIAALSQAVASSKLSQIAQGFIYDTDDEEKPAYDLHSAKDEALTYALDAAGAERSVIVYAFRHDLVRIEALLKKQKRSYGVLGGGRSIKQKMKAVNEWNEQRLDNLILHPASAGHGVELQFGGRRMFWHGLTWSSELYDQTLKRLDRPGQTEQVYSHQIIARDTVDLIKRNRVHFKINDQDAFKNMLRELK